MRYIQDLGGIKTQDGKTIKYAYLIKSSEIVKLSNKQKEYIDSLNLKEIIDIRHQDEIDKHPDYLPSGVKYSPISILEDNISAAANGTDNKERLKMLVEMETIEETYATFFTDNYSLKQIKKIVRDIVLRDDYPVLYHCVTGKDRTGIITLILLHMLNVDYDTITKIYLQPKRYYMNKALSLGLIALIASKSIKMGKKAYDFYVVKKENIETAINTINKNFGSMDNFIHNCLELSKSDIQKFKDTILE